eukprot:TRINITY_DN10592_c0_g1_i2.p1 TRINITY_DN10592_c0_g1~~TRINITY_DN10592_c0_g1_i2.p1  ORF type:complete len:215 (+),score=30.81 TRINITY_DN10592_c0_g1_i2:89-733(+)
MNPIRLFADLLHLFSILILLLKLWTVRNCGGISLKSQELYALVYLCRYLDLFWNFSSFYLVIMKIIFLASSFAIVYLMRKPFKNSYDKEHDSFRVLFLIVPCALLSLVWNLKFETFEVLWAFSIFLESVAIIPQLFLLQRTGEVENINSDYIFCLGAYRALYLINWVWRYYSNENAKAQWLPWTAGIVQTAVYCDFFYYYVKSKYYGKKMTLPK